MQGNYAGVAPYLHSPLYAFQQTGATVYYNGAPQGGQGNPTTDAWLPVWDAANRSDAIIFLGGIDNSIESEGNDRTSINWSGGQLDIIGQLAGYGKPMIVVQMGGGQIDSSPIANNPNISALLWGGYPGQSGGNAIVDIITGKASPAGRLPVTQYPAEYIAQIPMTDMTLRPNSTSGSPGRTYQWYEGKPIFEFGYGMHYTNFTATFSGVTSSGSNPSYYGSTSSSVRSYKIGDLISDCNETYMDRCPFQSISVDISNTGSVTSDYSILGFLTGSFGPKPYPKKQLKAYTRLHNVTAGSSQTAQLKLTLGSLARIADNGDTVLHPGDYALMIDMQPLAIMNFTLTDEEVTLDAWPQPPQATYQDTDYFIGGYGSTYDGETPLAS